jgi:putative 4-mercaptohistidine N1-methyltranferase
MDSFSKRDLMMLFAGAAVGSGLVCITRRLAGLPSACRPDSSTSSSNKGAPREDKGHDISTTDRWAAGSSASAAPAATAEVEPSVMKARYETADSVAQYLLFHYAPLSSFFSFDADAQVKAAHGFPLRIAEHAARHRPAQTKRALDLGCAVGVSSFVLSKYFDKVVGVDLSEAFITAAKTMQSAGQRDYVVKIQGELIERHTAKLIDAFGSDMSKVRLGNVEFMVGDAEKIELEPFDFILAANLICRVPHPRVLMKRLASLTAKGGVLVLLTPFSWTDESTVRSEWIGGTEEGGGRSEGIFKREMAALGFKLLEEGYEPFLIPDHLRRFQYGCPMLTIWKKE